jgi:hypothetical protein
MLLSWQSLGALQAVENRVLEKSDVPMGYEEAAKPEKAVTDDPQEKKANTEKQTREAAPEVDVPIGYGEASKAKSAQEQDPKKRAVPVVQPEDAVEGQAQQENIFAANPQLQAVFVQMQQQLKPFFAVELTFAKTVCQPSPKQIIQMKRRATPAFDQVIRSLAIEQGRGQGQQKDVGEQFEAAAGQIVAEVFPAETVLVYQEELRHRAEFQARVGAQSLVSHLDTQLRLNASQREALADSIQAEWQRGWLIYVQFLENNPEFFPPVTDQAILPHLNKDQAQQWKGMTRGNVVLGWQHLNMNRGVLREIKQEIDWFLEPGEEPQGEVEAKGFGGKGLLQGFQVLLQKAVAAGREEQAE